MNDDQERFEYEVTREWWEHLDANKEYIAEQELSEKDEENFNTIFGEKK